MTKLIVATVASLLAIASAPSVSAAVTVGNPAVAADVVDSCVVCTFVINQGFGVGGLSLSTYDFYANNAATITPFVASRNDVGTTANFTVTGIGTQRNAALGVNTFDFATVAGTNLTSVNSYFGFAYDNGGVVAFDYSSPTATSGTFVGPANYFPSLGTTFSSQFASQPDNSYDALNARTYSINATAVPEPSTWALMLAGFGMVGFALRRRKAVALTQSFG